MLRDLRYRAEVAPAWPDLKLKWMDRCVVVRNWEPHRKPELRFGSYFKCFPRHRPGWVKVYIDPDSEEWVGVRNVDSPSSDEEDEEGGGGSPPTRRNRRRRRRRRRSREKGGKKDSSESEVKPKRRFVEVKGSVPASAPPRDPAEDAQDDGEVVVLAEGGGGDSDVKGRGEGDKTDDGAKAFAASRSPSVECLDTLVDYDGSSESGRSMTIPLVSDRSRSSSSRSDSGSPRSDAIEAGDGDDVEKSDWLGATDKFLDRMRQPHVKVLNRTCGECNEAATLEGSWPPEPCGTCPKFGVRLVTSSWDRDVMRHREATVVPSTTALESKMSFCHHLFFFLLLPLLYQDGLLLCRIDWGSDAISLGEVTRVKFFGFVKSCGNLRCVAEVFASQFFLVAEPRAWSKRGKFTAESIGVCQVRSRGPSTRKSQLS